MSLALFLVPILFLSLTLVIPTCQVISYGTLKPPLTNRGMGFGEYQHTDPECKALHDMYWTHGPDGKVYHTWHPPNATTKAGKVCHFGHEHGHDPRTSRSFGDRPVPFGYVNDVHASSKNFSTTYERHEDHVGHKIHLKNRIPAKNLKTDKMEDSCDSMMKVHMGVHSPDAFTNNLHEVFMFVKCDKGRHVELKFLQPFGTPGQFIIPDRCPNPRKLIKADLTQLSITPPDSPSWMGDRMIADKNCAEYLFTKGQDFRRLVEHWVMGNNFRLKAEKDGKDIEYSVNFNPYFMVFNPIRFYDPDRKRADANHPPYTGYFTELCWENNANANQSKCQALRKEYAKAPAQSWRSCKSPFKGTIRRFSPNSVGVSSPPGGPHTVYTNALFRNPSEKKFAFSVPQVLDSDPNSDPMAGIGTDVVDFDSPSVCGPN